MTQVDTNIVLSFLYSESKKTEHLYRLVLKTSTLCVHILCTYSMLGLSNKEGKKWHYFRREYLRGDIGCSRLAGAQS